MKTGSHNCPDCGNLYLFHKDGTYGVACSLSSCEVGYCTSRLPDYVSDNTEYSCYISKLPDDWKPVIAWLANYLNIPIKQARNYHTDPAQPLIKGSATDILRHIPALKSKGLHLRFDPPFPYPDIPETIDIKRPLIEAEIEDIRELIKFHQ